MNWGMWITLLMPVILFLEWPYLKALNSKKDAVMFGAVWLLATAAIAAEWFGWPLPRPLDWIRFVCAPLNRLLP